MHPHYSKLDNKYSTGSPPNIYARPSPPYCAHHNVPRYPSNYRKRSSGASCLRCMYCCCCFMIFLAITIVVLVISLFNVYDPKIPEYKIEGLQVKTFDVRNSSLNTVLDVNVNVDNPNKKISFNYGEDSTIQVSYLNQNLCSGKLPAFHQAKENSTSLRLLLKGKTKFGEQLQKALSRSKKAHMIPVDVNVKVPVSIVLGEVPLREFKIYVYCHMTLDKLSPKDRVGILSKDTKFKFEL